MASESSCNLWMGHPSVWVSSESCFGPKNVTVVIVYSGLVLFFVLNYLNETMTVALQPVCSYANQNSPILSSC